jgi:hypothetical protein
MTARTSRINPTAVLRAGILIAIGVMAGSLPVVAQSPSPGATNEATAQPSESPLGSASPSASGSPLPTPPPLPPLPEGLLAIPPDGGQLEPGTYGTWSLGPLVRFTLGDGWVATEPDVSGLGWGIFRLVGQAPGALSMVPFTGEVYVDPCLQESVETVQIDGTPEGLVGELAANPNLFAGEPTETEIAGYQGLQLDVATQEVMVCDPPVAALWSIPERGLYMLELGQEARFMPIDVDGQTLVVVAETFGGADLEQLLEASQEVIDSIEIDTTAVPPSIPPNSASPSAAPSTVTSAEPAPTPSIAPPEAPSATP